MMATPTVRIVNRTDSQQAGFQTVFAHVDEGDSGEYHIANGDVGTQKEIDEILAQSKSRKADKSATKAGKE
jgi:hypothetical protein